MIIKKPIKNESKGQLRLNLDNEESKDNGYNFKNAGLLLTGNFF